MTIYLFDELDLHFCFLVEQVCKVKIQHTLIKVFFFCCINSLVLEYKQNMSGDMSLRNDVVFYHNLESLILIPPSLCGMHRKSVISLNDVCDFKYHLLPSSQ